MMRDRRGRPKQSCYRANLIEFPHMAPTAHAKEPAMPAIGS